jgi:hypothetical protein
MKNLCSGSVARKRIATSLTEAKHNKQKRYEEKIQQKIILEWFQHNFGKGE